MPENNGPDERIGKHMGELAAWAAANGRAVRRKGGLVAQEDPEV